MQYKWGCPAAAAGGSRRREWHSQRAQQGSAADSGWGKQGVHAQRSSGQEAAQQMAQAGLAPTLEAVQSDLRPPGVSPSSVAQLLHYVSCRACGSAHEHTLADHKELAAAVCKSAMCLLGGCLQHVLDDTCWASLTLTAQSWLAATPQALHLDCTAKP